VKRSCEKLTDSGANTRHRLRQNSAAEQDKAVAAAPAHLRVLRLYDRPMFLLVLVLLVMALGEYGVMVVLSSVAPSWVQRDALIDAVAIALLMFPVLLVLVVRPLQRQIAKRKETESSLRETIAALEEAAAQVRYLRGLLPICAACKRIRDTNGHWVQLEQYITTNSEASFTHGMCTDCSAEFYPGLGINRETRRRAGGTQ
jgi:hypothetical protein